MGTFLLTSKMAPALAARIEASVRGKRAVAGSARRRHLLSLARLGAVAALAGLFAVIVSARKRSAEQLETSRQAVLAAFHRQIRALQPSERQLGARMAGLIAPHTTPEYTADSLAGPLKTAASLVEALANGTIYVRGPLSGFSNPADMKRSAFESIKDTFLLCLLDPPDSRSELALRRKAQATNFDSKSSAAMASVERLFPLLTVMPIIQPE
jgi:hypothetical protein